MKLLPGKFTFGNMCVFVQVCMREKERGEILKYFEKAGHTFYGTLKGTLE